MRTQSVKRSGWSAEARAALGEKVRQRHAERAIPLINRFNDKWMPEPNSGCWLWMGNTGRQGYGEIKIRCKSFLAHRVSWELINGPIPKGLKVCHHCDTPACVNPDHLFLGTQNDNINDAISKNRIKRINGKWIKMRKTPVYQKV